MKAETVAFKSTVRVKVRVKHHNTNIKGSDQHSDPDKRKYVHKQAKMKSQRNATYNKKIRNKKHNRHQHNTDDGGQAMGEEMRHVPMSR